MCSGSEAGSYLRLIDSCITQLKAQGPSRTCDESKEEEDAIRKVRDQLPHKHGRDPYNQHLLCVQSRPGDNPGANR